MTKETLSAIALRVARDHGTGGWQTLEDMQKYALAFLAEVTKQAEPVAWMVYFRRTTGTDRLMVWNKEDAYVQVDPDLIERVEPLFDHPSPDVEELKAELAAKQARIDELMLEYCPNEMTAEQIAEYERNQRPA